MMKHILFEKIENFRDLGGYNARYGETSYGVIYRSAALNFASPKDVRKLRELGIKTIIDLRDDLSKAEYPDPKVHGAKEILLPVKGNGRVPSDRDDMIEAYMEILSGREEAHKILITLAHCEKPCVIHCSAGKDRTGVFSALILALNGVPFEEINADYLISPAFLEILRAQTKIHCPDFPVDVLYPNIDFLKDVADRFKARWGTVNRYLKWLGFDYDDTRLLKCLLGKQEKSCGAIVFNEGRILVEKMRHGHYSIPKGHVESFDESEEGTALREIKEETSLDVTIRGKKKKRIVYSSFEGISKEVVFFIADSLTRDTKPQPEEVEEILWCTKEEALRLLSHKSDKSVVRWAYSL